MEMFTEGVSTVIQANILTALINAIYLLVNTSKLQCCNVKLVLDIFCVSTNPGFHRILAVTMATIERRKKIHPINNPLLTNTDETSYSQRSYSFNLSVISCDYYGAVQLAIGIANAEFTSQMATRLQKNQVRKDCCTNIKYELPVQKAQAPLPGTQGCRQMIK